MNLPERTYPFFLVALLACGLAARAEPASNLPEERPITADERSHWAYQPIAHVELPAVNDPRFAANPIDRLIKAALESRAIEPLPRAGKATLARRVAFDLTGLPPSPEQSQNFLADDSPDAYEKLVDRLLASPAYGERWAQHWLDLARFAETDGFEHDLVRPNAWRYRDWVIDALNRDLPFDQFVRLQIAGDELLPDDRDAAIATGFVLCGPDMPDLNLQDERRHVVLNEITATVGAVFLGMQIGCAQCHDHKVDPIRQHDFYRLRAFFAGADIFHDHPLPTAEELAARQAAEAARPPEEKQRDERRQELESLARKLFREKNPDEIPSLGQALAELSKEDRQEHQTLVKQLKDAAPLPELSQARVLRDGPSRKSHFYLRGDFRQQGPVADCGFPQVLQREPLTTSISPGGRPRVALAAWLVRPDNPLTVRVIVNRLWQWHFGAPLAANASDFGLMGAPPTHPELLDWLARRFVADGWSMKKMHRLLVTSETYRLASSPYDAEWPAEECQAACETWRRGQAQDPDNHRGWHDRRQRLAGEAIRDAMLACCDRLSARRGGPGIRPPLPKEVTETLLKDQWKVSGNDEDHRRRSIYLFVRRNLRYPMFDVFDRPDTLASCPARHESTTATQSLTQFNSEFSLDCARWLSGAVLSGEAEISKRHIEAAYLRVLSRPPTADETDAALEFVQRQAAALRSSGRAAAELAQPLPPGRDGDPFSRAALVDFCLALFNSNEFLYVE